MTSLLLIHGWGFNRRVFDPLLEPLARAGIQASFWELPGHGRQIGVEVAPTLGAWAGACHSHLPRAPQVILGWSLGGQVAVELALRYPKQVQGLILVSTTPRFVAGADWEDGHDIQVFERFAGELEVQYEKTLSDFLWLQLRNPETAHRVVPKLRDALARGGAPTLAGLRAGLEILKTSDQREALRGGLPQPTALLAGKQDRLVLPGAIKWLAGALGIEAVWLTRGGHVPFLTDPDWFTQEVRGFLNAHAGL